MRQVELDRIPLVESDEVCIEGSSTLMPPERAAELAEMFKALSDPTRVRLLAHIRSSEHGTACACHLPETLGISQPTLSHHLKKLVDAGLIVREQRGRWAHYTAVADALDVARGFLGEPIAASTSCC
ncbi:metalloregulator ArsR/SmtB family transcription factor [Raineyella sp. W15-4]|uniref:ArsR/SmtB family transcription factor n=1 Tax=Raineyella sp. W15-4 TaxID=3081651 RepID=UPI0029538A95|nr:metalloregulator ArsR/SmtB family transcription factor [Raineyella sp. W15-4]WOQ16903.1 metalloregulator ArsR/SmtB family transcription factor [Raineyella sp. W15-4]